jgi:hypothetical protein
VVFDESAEVLLLDYTLGRPCEDVEGGGRGKNKTEPIIDEGPCLESGGYTVGAGPVLDPIVIQFIGN